MPKLLKRLLRILVWTVAIVVMFLTSAVFTWGNFDKDIYGSFGIFVVFAAFVMGDILLFSNRHPIDRTNRKPQPIEPAGKLSVWYHKQTLALVVLGGISLLVTIYLCALSDLNWNYIATPLFDVFAAYCMHYFLSRAAAVYLCFGYVISVLTGLISIFSSDNALGAKPEEILLLNFGGIHGILGILICIKPMREIFRFHKKRGTQTDSRNLAIVGFIVLGYLALVLAAEAIAIEILFKKHPDHREEALAYFLSITMVFLTILGCLRKLPGTERFPVTFIHNKNYYS